HRDHERIRPIRQEASDPPLKAAPERKLRAEDLVLTEHEKEHANTDAKVGEGPGIGVTSSAGDWHDTLPNCRERPNGSRLSCGRLARWRKSGGRTSRARQGTTQRLPLERARPAASSAC